jgi:predicted DCC family thiol-disulfide oxidoreductase YuxK
VREGNGRHLRVYFDQTCPLCRSSVRAALRLEDPPGALRFAPLGGETFRRCFGDEERAALPDSLVVETPDGALRVRSDAVVEVLKRLGRPGRAGAVVLGALPRGLRDAGYSLIARARRPFRHDPARCPRLPERLTKRIDP